MALVDDQVSVDESPIIIVPGEAARVAVGENTIQILPFQEVQETQSELTETPTPLGETGTSDLALL